MPIIQQTLNINNLRTTSAKSTNLHTFRKLIEFSLNVIVKAMFTLTVFEILLSKGRVALSPAQQAKGLTNGQLCILAIYCIQQSAFQNQFIKQKLQGTVNLQLVLFTQKSMLVDQESITEIQEQNLKILGNSYKK